MTSTLAITSMVCGIISLVFLISSIILGPLAISLGVIAIKRINEKPQELQGCGMAKAGVICGTIAVVIFVALIIFAFASA